VKKAVKFMVGFLLFGFAVFPARAAFTNLYVFGDSISSTTDNPAPPGPFYYGKRYSNGRVWVEVLAQRQGLTLYSTNNWSYFGNTSTSMVANVSSFQAPSNASNALFVIWVNNADLFYPAFNSGTSMNAWTNAMNVSLTNHFKAITNLYTKGARTLIMPNAVDISTIPAFNSSANTNFVHQRCLDYNTAFTNTLNRARTNSLYPGLTIYMPDFFTLLTNILAYPASYIVTNALFNGHSIDVYDSTLSDKTTNGPGTNYIFWDPQDPTAKVHAWMGNLAQQLISPVLISNFTSRLARMVWSLAAQTLSWGTGRPM
jgi:phospholipase/lecithinase/hemolysin